MGDTPIVLMPGLGSPRDPTNPPGLSEALLTNYVGLEQLQHSSRDTRLVSRAHTTNKAVGHR